MTRTAQIWPLLIFQVRPVYEPDYHYRSSNLYVGLVQNEQPDVIKLIRDLVEESISSPSTIILVTIPASGAISDGGQTVSLLTILCRQMIWRTSKLSCLRKGQTQQDNARLVRTRCYSADCARR